MSWKWCKQLVLVMAGAWFVLPVWSQEDGGEAPAASSTDNLLLYEGYTLSHPFLQRWDYHANSSSLLFNGYFNTASATVPAQFSNAFLFGGFIDQTMKDNATAKLNPDNYFGVDLDLGVNYHRYNESAGSLGNYIFTAAFRARNHADVKFGDKLFQMIFYGNAPIAGDTVDLSGLSFNRWRYNQLTVGMRKIKETGSGNLEFGAGLSVLQGLSFISADVSNGHVYTAADGELIDFAMNLEANFSDTGNLRNTAFNGIGGALDLTVAYEKPNDFSIRFNAADLGVIAWNSRASTISQDTAFQYAGLEIDDLLQFTEEIFDDTQTDSLLGILEPQADTGSLTTVLPVTLTLVASKVIPNTNLIISAGANYRTGVNYRPMVFLKGTYVVNDYLQVALWNSYGGYAGYKLGIELGSNINDRILIQLGSQGIRGVIIPDKATAYAFYGRIGVNF